MVLMYGRELGAKEQKRGWRSQGETRRGLKGAQRKLIVASRSESGSEPGLVQEASFEG